MAEICNYAWTYFITGHQSSSITSICLTCLRETANVSLASENMPHRFIRRLRFMQGFSKEVLDAIGLLTHNKEYEPYEEYIDRIIKSGNHLAIAVKMNDLRHNIARGKAGNHERLVQKHEAALDKFNKPMFQ